jgi:hypothetical protein
MMYTTNKENIIHYRRLIMQTNEAMKKDVKIMIDLDKKKNQILPKLWCTNQTFWS